jgi:hypothetical protein
MCHAKRLILVISAELLLGQFAAGQTTQATQQTQEKRATLDSAPHPRTVPEDSNPFPCYSRAVNLPKTFNGWWSPKPVDDPDNQVLVTIGFDQRSEKFPFDCVGETLDITVPNNQIVNLAPADWP